MRVALPPGHPLAARQVCAHRAIWRATTGSAARCRAPAATRCINLCREAGFEPKISFQSEDYEVIKGFVAGGLGVTILPELAGEHPGIELRP